MSDTLCKFSELQGLILLGLPPALRLDDFVPSRREEETK